MLDKEDWDAHEPVRTNEQDHNEASAAPGWDDTDPTDYSDDVKNIKNNLMNVFETKWKDFMPHKLWPNGERKDKVEAKTKWNEGNIPKKGSRLARKTGM